MSGDDTFSSSIDFVDGTTARIDGGEDALWRLSSLREDPTLEKRVDGTIHKR